MLAEVIAIGDEITSGQLVDTNSAWLSARLEELGLRVLYHVAVGDELEALTAVFRQALERSDVIVATGGLGPTADDLTRDALAAATGRKLVFNAAAMEHIAGLFARRGRPMPEQNRLQAMFPEGSRVVENPNGTAPGIDLELPRPGRTATRLFALPGVPAEMIEMWHGTVEPALRALVPGGRRIKHRRIKCFGAGESQIEAMLPDLVRRGREPRVGINASGATIILRITAAGASDEECLAAMEPTVAVIRRSLGELVFGEEDDELQDVVLRLVAAKGQTLATAEGYTGGMLAQWLAASAAAPGTYRGGLVLQGDKGEGEKGGRHHLPERPEGCCAQMVPATFFPLQGPADLETTARECRRRFGADIGLAVGPAQRQGEAGEDTAWLALASGESTHVEPCRLGLHPAIRQVYCAKRALNLLRLELLKS